jgi:hypothetical protein
MGYAHYFTQQRPFTQTEWDNIAGDTRVVFDFCNTEGITIWHDSDVDEPPEASDDCIWFNGPNDNGHETFCIHKDGGGFQFCKTARKPYDLAVCLVLLVIARHAPDAMCIGSDGDWDNEWLSPRNVAEDLFDYDVPACIF